jgi:hypothetical protein
LLGRQFRHGFFDLGQGTQGGDVASTGTHLQEVRPRQSATGPRSRKRGTFSKRTPDWLRRKYLQWCHSVLLRKAMTFAWNEAHYWLRSK